MSYNPFTLEGKTIFITGASSGIGRETAIKCSKMGAKLIINGRSLLRLQETYEKLTGINHVQIVADLNIDDEIERICKELPVLDGIIYCAGINEYIPFKFINRKKMSDIFNTNYFSQMLLSQKLFKSKKINKGASLVFVSSISSLLGVSATVLYASSKAAINASVRVMANELSSQKIRVNAICPGIVKTPMIVDNEILEESLIEQEKQYPLGLGTPQDVSGAIIFHLSDESRWLTGNIMVLDGGFTLQ